MSRQTRQKVIPSEIEDQESRTRRSTRATRSQSHDVEDNDAAATENPKPRQGNVSPSENVRAQQAASKRGKGRRGRPVANRGGEILSCAIL